MIRLFLIGVFEAPERSGKGGKLGGSARVVDVLHVLCDQGKMGGPRYGKLTYSPTLRLEDSKTRESVRKGGLMENFYAGAFS